MKPVRLYSKTPCPYCIRAKTLLEQKGVAYTEISLDGKPQDAEALFKKTGFRTVPQIFIGDECIGGCDSLYELEAEGRLDQLLKD